MKKALIILGCLAANMSQAQITTITGTGTPSYSDGPGGAATGATVNRPYGLSIVDGNFMFFADSANFVIRGIDLSSNQIKYFVGIPGASGSGGDGGDAYDANLGGPVDVKKGYSNTLYYVADNVNNVVRVIDTNTNIITTYAGNGSSGYSGDGGQATNAKLDDIGGICVDNQNNLYISCAGSIRKVTASTGIISTYGGTGTPGYNGDHIAATDCQVNHPRGIYWSDSGYVMFCDAGNNYVRGIGYGNMINLAGVGIAGYSGDGGDASLAGVSNPQYLAVDKFSNIFFSDAGNNCIRELNWATNTVSTVVGDGSGTAGFAGDGGAANTAQMNFPTGVGFDNNGNLYISDCGNSRIRKVVHLTQGLGVKSASAVTPGMAVYPNPAVGVCNISLPESVSNPVVRVINVTGNAVFTQYIQESKAQNISLNLKSVVPGNYLINVTAGDKTYCQKLDLQ